MARRTTNNFTDESEPMFEPTGDQAQWRVVYDHIRVLNVGDIVTDETLSELLPAAGIGSVRSAFWRAVKEMENFHQRTFDRQRNMGYRMIDAIEHERVARAQHKKARNRMAAVGRKLRSADRSRLDQATRQRFDALEINQAAQADMIRRLSVKVVRVENAVKAGRNEAKADNAALSEKVDRLAALLERHGITDAAQQP